MKMPPMKTRLHKIIQVKGNMPVNNCIHAIQIIKKAKLENQILKTFIPIS
jgi:hypothetical protein